MLRVIEKHIQEGNKEEARKLLKRHLQSNPEDSKAWLFAARVSNSKKQAISCLQKVVDIDPFNEVAAKQLQKLTSLQTEVRSKPPNKQIAKSSINTTYIIIVGVIVTLFVGFLILLAIIWPKPNISTADSQIQIQETQVVETMPATSTSTVSSTFTPTIPPTFTPTPESSPQPSLSEGTRLDPYPFGDGYFYPIHDWIPSQTNKESKLISVTELNNDAWEFMVTLNRFNREPAKNEKWVLVGITFKCDLPINKRCIIVPSISFELIGNNNKLYGSPSLIFLEEYELPTEFWGGDSATGYIGFMVDSSDSDFLLVARDGFSSESLTYYQTQ